eukprot:2256293-Rhodomonas_salina.1
MEQLGDTQGARSPKAADKSAGGDGGRQVWNNCAAQSSADMHHCTQGHHRTGKDAPGRERQDPRSRIR